MQVLNNSASRPDTAGTKPPVHQAVYEQLRDKILFGDVAPGEAVTIQGIAGQLGAGMTPVREAIRRLTSDGALNMMGNRRVIVPELSENGLEELDFMRKKIEPELARRATHFMTAAVLKALERHDTKLNEAISQGNIPGYLTQNYRFHATLYGAARAPIMSATVDRLWLRFGPSLRVVCGRHGTMNLPDKHIDLLKALAQRDPEAAALAISEDVDQGMNQIRAVLRTADGHSRFD